MPFGKYWRNRPFVFSFVPALPRALRVAEVDLDTGGDRELGVLGHLFALVPRQRLPQMGGEALHRGRQCDADGLSGVAVGEPNSIT